MCALAGENNYCIVYEYEYSTKKTILQTYYCFTLKDCARVNSLKAGGTVLVRRRLCPEAHAHLGRRLRGSKHLSSFGRFDVSGRNASDSAGDLRLTQPPPAPLQQITLALTDSPTLPGIASPKVTSTVPVPNPNEKLSHSTAAATSLAGSSPLWLQKRERRGPRTERSSLNLVRHSHERSQIVPLGQLDEILRADEAEIQPPATHSSAQFA